MTVTKSMQLRYTIGVASLAFCLLAAGAAAMNLTQMPLEGTSQTVFTENKGQWPDSVLFRGTAPGSTVWLTSSGWFFQTFQNADTAHTSTQSLLSSMTQNGRPDIATMNRITDSIEKAARTLCQLIEVRLVGANPASTVTGFQPCPGITNFYLGSDSTKWRTDVPSFEAVSYQNVYDDINLKFYGQQGRMEFDFEVLPGANPDNIRLAFAGQTGVDTSNQGDLLVAGQLDTVCLHKPRIYQVVSNKTKSISGHYRLTPDGEVSFALDQEYDRNTPLVIDPIITFGTYLGGSGDDVAWCVEVGQSDEIILAGYTKSADFPATWDQRTVVTTSYKHVFVTKLSAEGRLMFSTLLGGQNDDNVWDMDLGPDGSIYIAGSTLSHDYPTLCALYATSHDAYTSAIVTKLTDDMGRLIYSTYLDGSYREVASSIRVDSRGAALVAGTTQSPDFPVKNGLDTTYNGYGDVFVVKLAPDDDSLEFGTFFGGNDYEVDTYREKGVRMEVDSSGDIYLAGWTWSKDFPLVNAVDTTLRGWSEAFVAKLSPHADSIVYSTYLGGDEADRCTAIAVCRDGSAYVAGWTGSDNFPRPKNPNPFVKMGYDPYTFLVKLAPKGSSLLFEAQFGTESEDECNAVTVDPQGCVYALGSSYYRAYDAYLLKFPPVGTQPLLEAYIGGTGDDYGLDMVLDGKGALYISGDCSSSDLPVTTEPHTPGDYMYDAFVLKVEDLPTDVAETDTASLPSTFMLSQNYPNPFNGETSLLLSIPRRQWITLDIYNVMGQRVRTLIDKEMKAGSYRVTWDGRNDNGEPVASGTYFCQLRVDNQTETKKMVFLK